MIIAVKLNMWTCAKHVSSVDIALVKAKNTFDTSRELEKSIDSYLDRKNNNVIDPQNREILDQAISIYSQEINQLDSEVNTNKSI